MKRYSLSHLANDVLLRALHAIVAKDRETTAELLAHVAEVDQRGLYLPAAYPSMSAYCVGELRMSEDAAYKRIQAARAARDFPAIFAAVADGSLHLTAVVRLAPHLTRENADELLASAAHKSSAAIKTLLAERFPRPDLPAQVRALASASLALPCGPADPSGLLVSKPVAHTEPSGFQGPPLDGLARLAPLSPQRFALQLTMGQETHDKLRRAQALLGHTVATRDLAEVLDRALDALIRQLEKRKFAATERPHPRPRRASRGTRYIPADVKRAVWERDGGQCTFVSPSCLRCEARDRLEYDHVRPFACGGEATVEGLRLRCRGHNQFTAEQTFGAGFMSQKRENARRARAEARARRAAAAAGHRGNDPRPTGAAECSDDDRDVIPWLRKLGYGLADARRAAAHCESIPDASSEDRLRHALRVLMPPHLKQDFRSAAST